MIKHGRLSPEWLADFLVRTTAASWTASVDGYVWDIPEWRALTGQTQAEVEDMGWADAVHPDDRQTTLETWANCVRTGQPYQVVYRARMKTGEYRLFNVVGAPLRRSNGEIDQWFGVCFDLGNGLRATSTGHSDDLHQQLTPAKLRAARALAGGTVEKLAAESGVSATSIRRLETEAGLQKARSGIVQKVLKALESGGAGFVLNNGELLLCERVKASSEV